MPGGGPAVQVPSPPARSLHGPPSHVAPMPKFTDARFQEDFPGLALTPEQVEFGAAMERYMRLRHRPFPTWHEVLEVLLALGYRRVVTTPRPERPPSE